VPIRSGPSRRPGFPFGGDGVEVVVVVVVGCPEIVVLVVVVVGCPEIVVLVVVVG
jgi:hypothetical protein